VRCGADASAWVLALIGADVDPAAEADEEDEDPDSVLALIKSVPGNVSLESILAEIRKLTAIRAAGLPPGLFADVAPKVVSGWRARAGADDAMRGSSSRGPLPAWGYSGGWRFRCRHQSCGQLARAHISRPYQSWSKVQKDVVALGVMT